MKSEVGSNATNKSNRLRDSSENPFAKQKIVAHSPARLPPGKPQNKKNQQIFTLMIKKYPILNELKNI
jgi:hypothetical protein